MWLAYCPLVKYVYYLITNLKEVVRVENSTLVETWSTDSCING